VNEARTVLDRETFDVLLANELKRALRSQSFVTLVVMEPRGADAAAAVPEIRALVGRELRETDMLAVDGTTVSMVLLDADLERTSRVLERIRASLEHYQFATPVAVRIGAACCPTDGADIETLKRAAAAAGAAGRDGP